MENKKYFQTKGYCNLIKDINNPDTKVGVIIDNLELTSYNITKCEEIADIGEPIDIIIFNKERDGMGNISDGYHTFNELYHHRALLFAAYCNLIKDKPNIGAWKSKRHHDGTMYDNMFIVGISTPIGQASYHYDIDPYWDMFDVKELENAPEWDGHTPTDAIERIASLVHRPPMWAV